MPAPVFAKRPSVLLRVLRVFPEKLAAQDYTALADGRSGLEHSCACRPDCRSASLLPHRRTAPTICAQFVNFVLVLTGVVYVIRFRVHP